MQLGLILLIHNPLTKLVQFKMKIIWVNKHCSQIKLNFKKFNLQEIRIIIKFSYKLLMKYRKKKINKEF